MFPVGRMHLAICLVIALLATVSVALAGTVIPRTDKVGDVVPRYGIFEVTLRLPADYQVADPFTEVETRMDLTGPDGKQRNVAGFYFGEGNWKIRFAPDLVGLWQYGAHFVIGNAVLPGEGGWFTCVESANPGFVRQNPKNRFTWVFDNGQPYWPIGLQDCVGAGPHGDPFESWALEGGDRDGPWFASGTSADQYLDTYAQAGFNLFRFSPDNCSYSHFDHLDGYRLAEMAWTDELLEKLRDRGYRVFYGFIGYANAFIKEPDDPAKVEKVKGFLKYSVDRWGTYVDFWELLNEQDADPRWTTMMAEYVKSVDPYQHPVTDWEKGALAATDFNSPHWYEREPEEASDAVTADNAGEWKKAGKPVIVGEQGNDQNNWDYQSARRMRFRIWSALFNEISFVFWNTSYALNGHYMNIYLGPEERQYVRALQNFTAHLDAGMKSVPVARSDHEFRAYGLASDERVAVYLHNRFGRSLKGASITINVPKAGWAYWMAPDTLRLLGSFQTGGGEQTVPLPDFRQDLALLIAPEPITSGSPTPVIDANPRFGIAPQNVVFDGRRSVGAFGRPITSYEWSFGDGSRASGPTVAHSYPAGDYLATLALSDDRGTTASASLVVRVTKAMTTNRPPLALATAEPTSGRAPLAVHFRGEAVAVTGRAAGASWDFGDGATSDELEVEHVYGIPGTYLAELTVRSDHDSSARAQFVITVHGSEP